MELEMQLAAERQKKQDELEALAKSMREYKESMKAVLLALKDIQEAMNNYGQDAKTTGDIEKDAGKDDGGTNQGRERTTH